MEEIIKEIKKTRNIKDNSLKAYLIILKKLNNNKEVESLEYLKDTEEIMKKIKQKALTTQRNYIGSLLVFLPLLPEAKKTLDFYKLQLEKVNEEYQKFISSHEKSDKQKDNWSTLEELKEIFLKYKKEIKKNKYDKKEKLSSKEFNYLTNYLITALYILLPPVRLDYSPMSIVDKEDDVNDKSNFLVVKSRNKKHFIINEYKSSKTYGSQKINIPSELNSIINLYLKFHKDKSSFLMNTRGKELSANGLSKLLTSSFGRYSDKTITLNLLRHVYISENVKIKDADELKKENELAKIMMHSKSTQNSYVKV